MTRFIIAAGLCAAVAAMGCSRKEYVSKYPETVASNACTIPSSVFECDHWEQKAPAVESQQAAVAAERGTADTTDVERDALAYPSRYGAPPSTAPSTVPNLTLPGNAPPGTYTLPPNELPNGVAPSSPPPSNDVPSDRAPSDAPPSDANPNDYMPNQ